PFAALAAERVDGPVASYLAAWPDGRVKRALVERMLALRARWPATFASGAYVPLRVRGPLGRHVVAFARCSDEATVVVVATRLAGRLLGDAPELPRVEPAQWGDTAVVLPRDIDGPWMDGLEARDAADVAGGLIKLGDWLAALPVAVLVAVH
ncbi:malto-oligosyltrehalose synthase, partial [Burkholderia contaminans]